MTSNMRSACTPRAPAMPPTRARPAPARPLHSCWGAQPPHRQTCSGTVTTCPASHPPLMAMRLSEELQQPRTLGWHCPDGAGCSLLPSPCLEAALGIVPWRRGQHRAQGSQSLLDRGWLWADPVCRCRAAHHGLRNFEIMRTGPAHPQKSVLHIPMLLPLPALPVTLARRLWHVPGQSCPRAPSASAPPCGTL